MLAKRFRVTVGPSRSPTKQRSTASHGYHYPHQESGGDGGLSYRQA